MHVAPQRVESIHGSERTDFQLVMWQKGRGKRQLDENVQGGRHLSHDGPVKVAFDLSLSSPAKLKIH